MAALGMWNGALLVERVGSGKTWIALGVAAAHPASNAVAIVPAILQDQWRSAARGAGIPLQVWSHERTSRGQLPAGNPRLVLVDEAHRFREPSTRRLAAIAPWLLGRRTLLITATPIVNRLGDLVTLLRLALPEDALALDGVSRLGDLAECGTPSVALRRVVIRSDGMVAGSTDRQLIRLTPAPREAQRGVDRVTEIGQLALSSRGAVRRLIASVLLDAAASSDEAFQRALKRYRGLLLQSQDAGGASRAMLRRFAGDALEQVVLWPMLSPDASGCDLPGDDIAVVDEILRTTGADHHWIDPLLARCADDRVTVCFTRHRATARLLRQAFGDDAAWLTGTEAGIGPHRLSRDTVLAAFGARRDGWTARRQAPRVLVATDVAAEGLDLFAAGRVVHVDLPWTATRIEQREGRLLRIGQRHDCVEVVVRAPPAAIESALAPQARLHRKEMLAAVWLTALERTDDPPPPLSISLVGDDSPGADLVAVQLQSGTRQGALLIAREGESEWTTAPAAIEGLLRRAAAAAPLQGGSALIDDTLSRAIRAAIATLRDASMPPIVCIERIHRLARNAASRRDAQLLQRLDRMLRFVSASPTLGARMTMSRLTDASEREFLAIPIPDVGTPVPVCATPIAAILFRHAVSSLR